MMFQDSDIPDNLRGTGTLASVSGVSLKGRLATCICPFPVANDTVHRLGRL